MIDVFHLQPPASRLSLRTLARDIAALGILGSILAALLAFVVIQPARPRTFSIDKPAPDIALQGFYGAEQNIEGGFRWSGPQAHIRFPAPIVNYRLTLFMQSGAADSSSHQVAVTINGQSVGNVPVNATRRAYDFYYQLTPWAGGSQGAQTLDIGFQTEPSYIGDDRRALGIVISDILVEPLQSRSPLQPILIIPNLLLLFAAYTIGRLAGLSVPQVFGIFAVFLGALGCVAVLNRSSAYSLILLPLVYPWRCLAGFTIYSAVLLGPRIWISLERPRIRLMHWSRPVRTKFAVFWYAYRCEVFGLLGVVAIVGLLGFRLIGPTTTTPGDVLGAIQPWNVIMPRKPYHGLLSDAILAAYPQRKYINEQVQAGEFPLWNPYILTGFPLAGDPQSALFYPTTIGLGWLSPGNAFDMQILIHLFVCVLGMYVFVRMWGGSQLGALAAAIAFSGCSALTVWQQFPNLFIVGAWLPWLVIGYELSQRRRLLGIALGGVVLGLILLANFLQYALYDLFFLGCYALWLTVADFRKRRGVATLRPLIDCAAIVLLGCAIGAVQLLPLLELLQLSARRQPHSFAILQALALPLPKILTMVSPSFFGTPLVGKSTWGPSNYAETTLYWGLIPCILALTAPLWHRERQVWFMWAFFLLVGSMLLGAPTLYLFAVLPGFNGLANVRLIYIVCFSGAALCGLVLDRIVASRSKWPAFVATYVCIVLAPLILYVAFRHYTPVLPTVITPILSGIYWTIWIGGLSGIALALVWLPWRRRLLTQGVLLLLIVVDIAAWNLPYNDTNVNEATLYPRPTILSHIPSSIVPSRVAVIHHFDALFVPNSLMALGLADVGGYDSLIPEAYKKFAALASPPVKGYVFDTPNTVVFSRASSPLLDLLGAEYLLSNVGLENSGKQLEHLGFEQSVVLYRNMQAAPRAFIVPKVQVVIDQPTALQQIATPSFSPCTFAVVERLPVAYSASSGGAQCIGAARIVDYRPNDVVISAETPAAGLLVLSDMYYPGWKVVVDGHPQPIYRVDGVFRGVWLTAGQHEIHFSFRPPLVIFGASISLVALICATLMASIGMWRVRRSQ